MAMLAQVANENNFILCPLLLIAAIPIRNVRILVIAARDVRFNEARLDGIRITDLEAHDI
jgi:hypothetical protein